MEVGMQPLASIVVITYNQEKSLPVTLDSLLAQKTSFPFEIVVGDDCSKDGTRTVLADYADRYPEIIRPIYNEHNLGILGNYVSTLRQCRGKYISGCAGDDHWSDPEKLQLQVDIMEKDPEIGLVYTDVYMDSVTTGEKSVKRCKEPQKDLFTQLLKGCFITAPTACFRASLLDYVDFDEFRRLGFIMEDYPMWLTFSLHTKFYHLKRPTITYKIERDYIKDARTVSLHACEFDEGTTAVRLHFLRKYSDKTPLTEDEIQDAHYKICYLAGLNMNDRNYTKQYADRIHHRTPYIKRLSRICSSPCLFWIYQTYRKLSGKTRTPLQMYFGQ
ncbi:MAG: glycosyltransferase [Bacteroidales bacterium]|nr:glycosyltransferase [Bacteroidales bacterium]